MVTPVVIVAFDACAFDQAIQICSAAKVDASVNPSG